MNKIFLSSAVFFTFNLAIGQNAGWNTYTGTVGGNDIVMNLYHDGKGNLKGNYCYKKYDTRIILQGKKTENSLVLDEFSKKQKTARFEFALDKNDQTENAKWINLKNQAKQPLKLRLANATLGELSNHYGLGAGTNQAIELFLYNVKKSFLSKQSKWLADNIAYPIDVNIGGKRTIIKTKQQFINNFPKIANNELMEQLKNYSSCEIFSNEQGVMIANGAVWINKSDKGNIKITAINN